MRLAEREYAVVEHHILLLGEVFTAQGSVSIQLVHFLAWRTGNQTDPYGIQCLSRHSECTNYKV